MKIDLTSVEHIIGAVAPTIATALGGPLAGMAVRALSGALLGRADGTTGDIETALLSSSPDQLVAIKKIDAEFAEQMKSLDVDLERIAQQDRSSARDMQISNRSFLVPTIATIVIVSFVSVTIGTLLGFAKIESAMAGTLVGYISAKAELVLAFYFGSSAGSQRKDELLYKSTPTN